MTLISSDLLGVFEVDQNSQIQPNVQVDMTPVFSNQLSYILMGKYISIFHIIICKKWCENLM